MLNDLTTQQFFDILTKYQSELCGKICSISMLASLVGTLLYWLLSDVAKLIYEKVFVCKKGRDYNEKE